MNGLDYDTALEVLRALKVQGGNDAHALLVAAQNGEGYPSPTSILGISIGVYTNTDGLFIIRVSGSGARTDRWCYWINEAQDPALYGGYVASVVTENEPGHTPIPRGNHYAANAWGLTLDEAKDVAAEQNAALGLTPDDVLEIRMSSMRASNVVSRGEG